MTHSLELDRIFQGDCVEGLNALPACTANLVFADPPFNIGFEYDAYDDRKAKTAYLDWSKQWMEGVRHVLTADGAFWLAIGDEYAAELKLIAQEVGFTCRSWVIWYYTFGVHCHTKFTRSHAHIFHFVKDASKFVFNDKPIRVPSARQLVYNDRRANSAGRLPDDTWILRPQDLVDGFTPDEDVWYFPRVAGTFKERAGFHGCQMPEQLLGRIVKSTSNERDVVIDPFSGSGTTLAVAKKLNRRWLGFDVSPNYVELASERIANVRPGDDLTGSAEPQVSAPKTIRQKKSLEQKLEAGDLSRAQDIFEENDAQLVDAFKAISRGFSIDRVVADPILNEDFQSECDRHDVAGTPFERNTKLFSLRKRGVLKSAGIVTTERTVVGADYSQFLHGSEIAWRTIADKYNTTLDSLLCDPRIASEFDLVAAKFAPGFRPLEYRWGALRLRKISAAAVSRTDEKSVRTSTSRLSRVDPVDVTGRLKGTLPNGPGVFSIHSSNEKCLFVGETTSLSRQLPGQLLKSTSREAFRQFSDGPILLRTQSVDTVSDFPYARHCRLVSKMGPRLNAVGKLAG